MVTNNNGLARATAAVAASILLLTPATQGLDEANCSRTTTVRWAESSDRLCEYNTRSAQQRRISTYRAAALSKYYMVPTVHLYFTTFPCPAQVVGYSLFQQQQ